MLVAWPLLAFGGVYPWAAFPLILGCAGFALSVRPRVSASAETRWLDGALLVCLAGAALPLVPLPHDLLTRLAPGASSFYGAYQLGYSTGATAGRLPPRAISIDPEASAFGLALAVALILLFWTCRRALEGGGTRQVVRGVAYMGLLIALLAIVQRATSPDMIYWRWKPLDTGAEPFGPFVNRNHFATWLLMAIPLVTGYLVMRVRSHAPREAGGGRLQALAETVDTRTVWLAVAICLMTISLFLSASRSALLSFAVVIGLGAWLARSRLDRPHRTWMTVYALVVLVIVTTWSNVSALFLRLDATLAAGTDGRLSIWRETLPVIRDFWPAGTGLGTYRTAMLVYQQSDRSVYFNQAHNHYLQLAAEGGLLLSIPAAFAIGAFLRLAYRRLRAERSDLYWIRAGAAMGLVAVLLQSVMETGLRIPANGVLCAVLAAIAVHQPRHPVARGPTS